MSFLSRLLAPFRPAPTVELRAVQPQPFYQQVATFRLFDWMAGIPDPDEVLRRTGRTRSDLRQLLRHAEVSQALETRREAVLATPWRLEDAKGTQAAFVEEELGRVVEQLVACAWEAVPYGYSVAEVVFARRGARIGIDRVHAPAFEWFRPIPDGSVKFFPQDGSGGMQGLDCDPAKFLLTTRNGNYRNPYGEALLSVLYWPVTWSLQGWQLWLDFLETFGAPIVVGRTASYAQFVDAMATQGVKRAVGWQPVGDNESMETITASTPGEFERLEKALEGTIQRVVLGQTLTSDVGKTGSFAAAKVHNEVREDKRRADVRMVMRTVQGLIDTLWTLNGFAGEAPEFVMQDDTGLEKDRADRDAVLAEKLGVRFTPEYLVERYDLEEEDFTIVDPTPAVPAPGAPAADPNADPAVDPNADPEAEGDVQQRAVATLAAPRYTRAQQRIEDGVAQALAAISQSSPGISDVDLQHVIRSASDPTDLVDRLTVLMSKSDPAEFRRVLERALFAADILGYAHATAPTQ